MAQRHRAGIEQQASSSTHQQPYISSASSSSSNLLSTQTTRHPLGLSTSAPPHNSAEGYARRRRRSPSVNNELHGQTGNSGTTDEDKAKHGNHNNTTTLDKLEDWLGISSNGSPNRTLRPPDTLIASPKPINRSSIRTYSSRVTQLVIVHAVASTDTLESIALRYKSDVRVIRRANGFWPGDSVSTRKELYIPIEEDSEFNQAGTMQAGESLSKKLFLLNSMEKETFSNGLYLQNRPLSSRSISSMSAASQTHSGQHGSPSQEVRRMNLETLSHFPPPGTTPQKKGKEKVDDEPAFAYAEAMRPGRDLDHGESGVDDLLQLAEKARSRGGSPPQDQSQIKPLQSARSSVDDMRSVSPSSSFLALEEPWKPNKWTFGQKSSKGDLMKHSLSGANGSQLLISAANSTGYNGWNDIPEPPLNRTAKGQVAHAYKGGSKTRRYPRTGNVNFISPSATIIDDLAAGLPPNQGPAANWARPIGDSLPIPQQGLRKLHTSKSLSRLHSNNQGWGQIFSDTVRGKIGLDEALERGFEDIRKLAISSITNSTINGQPQHLNGGTAARRRLLLQADGTSDPSTPPARPSAELARATLSDRQSTPSSADHPSGAGVDVRRTSERSIHELEELDGKGNFSTNRILYAGDVDERDVRSNLDEVRRRERKNIRNVDWLN